MVFYYAGTLYLLLLSVRNAYGNFIFTKICGIIGFELAKIYHLSRLSLKILAFMHSDYSTGSKIHLC